MPIRKRWIDACGFSHSKEMVMAKKERKAKPKLTPEQQAQMDAERKRENEERECCGDEGEFEYHGRMLCAECRSEYLLEERGGT